MKRPAFVILAVTAVLFAFFLGACSDDPDETEGDVGVDEDAGYDVEVDEDATVDPPPARVPLELDDYMADVPDSGGTVSVYEATEAGHLIGGDSATSRVGDFILENDLVRFAVQDDVRTMTPCPWGGNIVDAEYRSDDYGGDILGEVCMFLNADQTFKPETYEIIHDGSEGAAVLAVSGSTAILDYLNVEGMIYQLGGSGMANMFQLKPDDLLPLRITKYYVLRAGDTGVRVLTAIRNDGDEDLSLVPAHLMVNGADGDYFNPLSSLGGFGYVDRGLANPNPDRLPFLAMLSDNSSVAYAPKPDERLDGEEDLPIAGAYLTIFNVAASVLGQTNIIGTLLASLSQLEDMEGVLQFEPGHIEVLDYRVYVGSGELASVVDPIYENFELDTAQITGHVVDAQGQPVVGARVSAVDSEGRTMNQAVTDGDGQYSMVVPEATYEIFARSGEQFTVTPQVADASSGGAVSVDELVTQATGFIEVNVSTPDGEPTPARVSVICDGECPHKATSNERDVTIDDLPDEFATIEWVGVDGTLTFAVPEGNYQILVSRGMEWSLWPHDGIETGGEPIEVVAGQTEVVDAEIARVLDTSGALSGDFHVHSLSSLDSTTPHEDRILTFLTEGVDVVISSDHDVVADYGPALEAVGAQEHMVTMIGTEITTIDLGHYNAFPIVKDEEDRLGGTLDWAGGEDLALTPAEIFEWINEFPDEQVVQINHPDSSFMAFSDVLRGISYGEVSRMRVRTPDYDPDTGETGLWSDEFTAMELMNGPSMSRFYGVARWWLTMIGRGQVSTGTAVTDTHTRFGRVMGGVPRTFVFVDDDKDSATTFDAAHFVSAVNGGRAIGTNGPFVTVEAVSDGGERAQIGEVLYTAGQEVTLEVTIQIPEWVHVDRIEMLMNPEDAVTDGIEYNTSPIEPTETFPVSFAQNNLVTVAGAGANAHRRYEKTVEITVEPEEDSYVVFFVRGTSGMYPVLPDDEIEPFAFTNPVFLDVDGGGYDNPPLAQLADSEPPAQNFQQLEPSFYDDHLRGLERDEQLQYIIDHAHHLDSGQCH